MNRHLYLLLAPLLLVFFGGCQDTCENEMTFYQFEPVYMSFEELRQNIEVESPRALERPGKIYFWNNFIFIGEKDEGVHIISNLDPSDPQAIAFLPVKGNNDIAVKNGTLLLDQFTDLVTFDISDPANPQMTGRAMGVFPYETWNPQLNLQVDPSRGVVTDWVETQVTEIVDCDTWDACQWGNCNVFFPGRNMVTLDQAVASAEWTDFRGGEVSNAPADVTNAAPAEGVGGSLARFAIVNDRMYVVNWTQILSFDISSPANPQNLNMTDIGWGIETIFPYRDHLFIGTQTGMLIYGLQNPDQPDFVGNFTHMRNCDPVAVDGNTAYVTLRSGQDACVGTENELNVIDVTNLANPTLIGEYQLFHPAGVGARDGAVYVCDDDEGLKVFDAEDRTDLKQVKQYRDINALDVIALPGRLFMIGQDGFYQYDASDPLDLKQLSFIPVTPR